MIQLWPLLVISLAPLAAGLRLKPGRGDWDVRTALASTLLCTLSFALTFFWQELWLVIPKALTPGLEPTLYHNDHRWSGDNPIAELLQGTGAIATLTSGLVFLFLLTRLRNASTTWALFLFWMAFQGLFQALTQLAIGTLVAGNDMGRALAYLGAGSGAKLALFAGAVVAMYAAGRALAQFYPCSSAPPFTGELSSAQRETEGGLEDASPLPLASLGTSPASGGRERGFVLAILVPALLAVALLIAFRVPREMIEVVLIPLIVNGVGAGWVVAGAVASQPATRTTQTKPRLIAPAIALCVLLAFFQFVLRPGVAF